MADDDAMDLGAEKRADAEDAERSADEATARDEAAASDREPRDAASDDDASASKQYDASEDRETDDYRSEADDRAPVDDNEPQADRFDDASAAGFVLSDDDQAARDQATEEPAYRDHGDDERADDGRYARTRNERDYDRRAQHDYDRDDRDQDYRDRHDAERHFSGFQSGSTSRSGGVFADDGDESGFFVRNMLIAAATVPFVFLLVLIIATFVFGTPDEGGPAGREARRAAAAAAPVAPQRARSTNASTDADLQSEKSPVLATARIEGFNIDLPVAGVVDSVGLDGERLAILVENEGAQSIVIYHVAKGAVLATLPIAPGGAGRAEAVQDPAARKALASVSRRKSRDRAHTAAPTPVEAPAPDTDIVEDEDFFEDALSSFVPRTPTLKATVAPRPSSSSASTPNTEAQSVSQNAQDAQGQDAQRQDALGQENAPGQVPLQQVPSQTAQTPAATPAPAGELNGPAAPAELDALASAPTDEAAQSSSAATVPPLVANPNNTGDVDTASLNLSQQAAFAGAPPTSLLAVEKEPVVPARPTKALRTVSPNFPRRCKAKGGGVSVTVEFDIDEQGAVVNQRIAESDNSCFDASVLRAIGEWEYAPKVVDSGPVMQRGVRQPFTFKFEN